MTDTSAPSTSWKYENFEPAGSAIGYRITRKLDEVQSPPPMITTRFGSSWVNSAGCDIISW